ncbi:hypothetical protein [Chromobacterium phragmitis]|uniref:Uncharacterized protein n=1 Tax=Chromobacterium phragmitis TaxID=2202141 RepID=A0A344UPI9_9NEIS|nr:hypothetical protein [Chromobacterium phragmitis]AXE37187.1 hypothetical protein DK843_22830 [Chromobacterium phragmitis]
MLIECKQKREGGTVVILGDVLYHFLPDVQGRHVVEVENDDHVAEFLAIKEGYALAKELPKTETEDKPGDEPAKPARGSKSKKPAGEGEDKSNGSDDASKNGEQG